MKHITTILPIFLLFLLLSLLSGCGYNSMQAN